MTTKNKQIFFLILFALIFFTGGGIITEHEYAVKGKVVQAWRHKNLKGIEFKGKVVNSIEVERNGRYYTIACLQLDYSSIDSCYLYDPEESFLRIKNDKVVMMISDPSKSVDYVEVNMNEDGKEKFYKDGKLYEEYELSLSCNGLLKSDLTFCDEPQNVK
jgi:hypothetical protein